MIYAKTQGQTGLPSPQSKREGNTAAIELLGEGRHPTTNLHKDLSLLDPNCRSLIQTGKGDMCVQPFDIVT